MYLFKSTVNSSRTNVKAGPIQINMKEIENLIRTAHENSKVDDIKNSIFKHRNIINMSKDFIKAVTKNPDYDEDRYVLNIEVKEKKPFTKQNENEKCLNRILKFRKPRKNYKVIDATIEPKLFAKDLITNEYNEMKRLKTIRVICLAIITENRSWGNTLQSYIPLQSFKDLNYDEEIDIKEVIIEWEEEFIDKNKITQKRFKTHLSKNTNANYTKDYAMRLSHFNSMYNGNFKMDTGNKVSCACNASQVGFKITEKTNYSGKYSRPNTKNSKSIPQYQCEMYEPENQYQPGQYVHEEFNNFYNPNFTLNAEISEVKHKVLKVIESIAVNSNEKSVKDRSANRKESLNSKKYSRHNYALYYSDKKPKCSLGMRFYNQKNEEVENKNSQNSMHKRSLKSLNKEICENEHNERSRNVLKNESDNNEGCDNDKEKKSDFTQRGYHAMEVSNKLEKIETQFGENKVRVNVHPHRKCRKRKLSKRKMSSQFKNNYNTSVEEIYEYFCKQIEEKRRMLGPNNKELNTLSLARRRGVRKKSNDSTKSNNYNVSSKTEKVKDVITVLKTKLKPHEIEALKLLLKENPSNILNQLESCSETIKKVPTTIKSGNDASHSSLENGVNENLFPTKKKFQANVGHDKVYSTKDHCTGIFKAKRDTLINKLVEIETKQNQFQREHDVFNKILPENIVNIGSKLSNEKLGTCRILEKTELPNKLCTINSKDAVTSDDIIENHTNNQLLKSRNSDTKIDDKVIIGDKQATQKDMDEKNMQMKCTEFVPPKKLSNNEPTTSSSTLVKPRSHSLPKKKTPYSNTHPLQSKGKNIQSSKPQSKTPATNKIKCLMGNRWFWKKKVKTCESVESVKSVLVNIK